MFSRDRYNLSRFSLGSQDTIIPIEVTFSDDLKQVAGAAVPVPSTAFFNDVVRGTLRGAIAVKSAFESAAEVKATCSMNANMNLSFMSSCAVGAKVEGSQNSNIVAWLSEDLISVAYGSKTIPHFTGFIDDFITDVFGVKNIKRTSLLNEVMTSITDASSQTTEITRIDITLPPGAEIRIDSETYRALMNGENVLYAQSGDWLTLSRELLHFDVESATGGSLDGTIIYTERYL